MGDMRIARYSRVRFSKKCEFHQLLICIQEIVLWLFTIFGETRIWNWLIYKNDSKKFFSVCVVCLQHLFELSKRHVNTSQYACCMSFDNGQPDAELTRGESVMSMERRRSNTVQSEHLPLRCALNINVFELYLLSKKIRSTSQWCYLFALCFYYEWNYTMQSIMINVRILGVKIILCKKKKNQFKFNFHIVNSLIQIAFSAKRKSLKCKILKIVIVD